jgi:hypothetical protein
MGAVNMDTACANVVPVAKVATFCRNKEALMRRMVCLRMFTFFVGDVAMQ